MMTESHGLLAEYATNGSEAAFREIVTRYVDLVYSAAIRLVNGDVHRAQDVTQTVFLDLARKASSLSSEIMIGGWLHRHTCFVAANVMRGERRRQQRERTAVEMNANEDHSEANLSEIRPVLDDAINQLGPEDRSAILLRFFEKRDFHFVGEALGASENAAQKRVSRALDELRGLLRKRGVSLSVGALGTVIATEAVTAAPAGLAAGIAASATTGAVAGGTTSTLLTLMETTKWKIGIAGALAAGVVAPLLLQFKAGADIRKADNLAQQQTVQLDRLLAENDRLSKLAAGVVLSTGQSNELEQLRAETGALQQSTNDLAKLRQEYQRLHASLDQPKTPMQIKEGIIKKMNSNKYWLEAFYKYAETNQGRFPASFAEAAPFHSDAASADARASAEQFEIVFRGSPSSLANPENVIVLREKESWDPGPTSKSNIKASKIYGFADGHVEVVQSTNFEEYESLHGVTPPTRR